MRGRGLTLGQTNDPAVDGPILSVDPSFDSALATLPRANSETLVAPFRTLSFLVRNQAGMSIDLRIRSSDGRLRRLRYDERVSTTRSSGHRSAVLPLVTSTLAGSTFRLATLNLSEGLAVMDPSVTVEGVLVISVRGRFEIGDLVLGDAVK
jgi:hypothetical protein